jgi:hypothetical protein
MHGLFYAGTVICLEACLVVGQATAAGPSLSQEPAKPTANSRSKARQSPGSRGYWLDVTVKNPRCPACLKTLKTYLLALNGVQEVNINYLAGRDEKVDILVRLASSLQRARVIERIKAHDLEILDTKP